jgi:TRAP-type mannitol/chloroaromatic compound transport system substrate-binding protein
MTPATWATAAAITTRRDIEVPGLSPELSRRAKPAVAQNSPAIKWRLTASRPKSLDIAYGACEIFWWQVAEYSYDTFMIRSRSRT